MVRKISQEMREQAWIMYQEGERVNPIAKKLEISYASAYQMTIVREKGFSSSTAYQKHLREKRATEPRTLAFTALFNDSLRTSGFNQHSFSKKSGIPKQTVNDYAHGILIPKEDRLRSMLEIMGAEVDQSVIDTIYSRNVPQSLPAKT